MDRKQLYDSFVVMKDNSQFGTPYHTYALEQMANFTPANDLFESFVAISTAIFEYQRQTRILRKALRGLALKMLKSEFRRGELRFIKGVARKFGLRKLVQFTDAKLEPSNIVLSQTETEIIPD